MPPEKLYFPETKGEFDRLEEEARDKYLPLLDKLQLHDLLGLNLALEIALDNIKPLVAQEDVRRGHRPPGTRIGR